MKRPSLNAAEKQIFASESKHDAGRVRPRTAGMAALGRLGISEQRYVGTWHGHCGAVVFFGARVVHEKLNAYVSSEFLKL